MTDIELTCEVSCSTGCCIAFESAAAAFEESDGVCGDCDGGGCDFFRFLRFSDDDSELADPFKM